MAYLLDSDVLIDVSRNRQEAIDYVDTLPEPWAISQVTAMELLVGARNKKEVIDLDAFLSSFPIVPLSDSIGRKAYQLLIAYAKSHGLLVFDSVIAATAIDEGFTLVTRNRKHFTMIDGISLQIPRY
ncbi:putative Ribonuclease VapC19 [Candidatus Sulfopaludibacter sp. SbA4]|nr:putative Ribonuclease VapC19 [Candidatus Sulfopaludibacter sp. SbA4]